MPKQQTLNHRHCSADSDLDQLITSYDDVISSFDDVTRREDCRDLDLDFLKNVLESVDFLSLLKVHDRITTPDGQDSQSVSTHASEVNESVIDTLDLHGTSAQSTQLQNILQRPHFKALLDAHDQIASKQFCPQLPEVAPEVDEDENLCVKVLTIIKADDEPLGATIQRSSEDGSIKVARIMHGGAADRSGLLSEGDEVKQVNDHVMNGHSPEELVSLLENTSGPVRLRIGPGGESVAHTVAGVVKVRAKFDYNPGEDPFTPCPEASLAFSRGDVLDIVDKSDTWWWQAKKHGDQSSLAALIPSRLLTERVRGGAKGREGDKENKGLSDDKSSRFSPKTSKKSKKTKHATYDYSLSSDTCYEQVQSHDPNGKPDRPIILISTKPEQAKLIRDRLLGNYPDAFTTPVLCSNQPQSESNDRHTFIQPEDFELLMRDNKVLEQEDVNGHTTALLHNDLVSSIGGDRTCIVSCKAESIHTFRRSDIKPHFIYFKPPIPERSKSHSMFSRKSKDIEGLKLAELNTEILEQYGHVLDQILPDSSPPETDRIVATLSEQLKHEISWVPVKWDVT